MFGGLNRLLTAALAAGAVSAAVLAASPAALACNSGTSAVNVYKECTPSGGGSKPAGNGGGNGGPSTSTTGGASTPTPHHFTRRTAKALNHAGKDKPALQRLVSDYGLRRRLQASRPGPTAAPSAIGSAFDLGSGPTALLIVLAGTAALLLGGSGVRVWRTRHRA